MKAKSKIPGLTGWAGDICARVMKSPRFPSILLVTILVCEFALLSFKASRKLFWYDEMVTVNVSSIQPFSLFWTALKAGADGMPLGYYLLVRLARLLPGDPQLALRLPSILGYLMTLPGIYWFARKKLPAIAGLAAVFFVVLSPFRAYAIEARSYALLIGFLAIAAVLWQSIGEKRLFTPLFALFLALAVSMHHLAVVVLSAFGIAELTWTLLSRRIRWGVWVACLLAASPFFINLPILLHYRTIFGKAYWEGPTLASTIETYGYYLGLDATLALVLIVFFGIAVGVSFLRLRRTPGGEASPDEPNFSPSEIMLVAGFLYYPVLLEALTKVMQSGYTSRYAWPAILGLVLGSVYLLRSIWLKSSSTWLLAAFLIAFAYQGGSDLWKLHKAGPGRVDNRWTRLAELSHGEPDLPVVIASPIAYLEAAEYAPPELRGRLVEVIDTENAERLLGVDSTDKTNRIMAQFVPLHNEDLRAFQAAHQKFIVRSGGGYDWFTQYLIEKRYRLDLLSTDAGSSIYLAER